jgi:hypothetical protein
MVSALLILNGCTGARGYVTGAYGYAIFDNMGINLFWFLLGKVMA